MRFNIGITDSDWFEYLAAQPNIDEVNFWRPGGETSFTVLQPGEPFLFKLHAPDNFIVGGGFFAHFSRLPVSLAWEAFTSKNGATTFAEMRARVEKYRRRYDKPVGAMEDYTIGCILLQQPFFFPRRDWVPVPRGFPMNTVQGKSYDAASAEGAAIWNEVSMRIARHARVFAPQIQREAERYGAPTPIRPRLGQGSFRVIVTDAYERRCAVTGERTLPVLEAAHIQPYGLAGEHRIDNGLLLRSDLHTLFDRGYVTVTPDYRVEVSRRIREEFENGRDYYVLQGKPIRLPSLVQDRPRAEFLNWHRGNLFKG